MIVAEDCDVRQSIRILELQNRDLWIRQQICLDTSLFLWLFVSVLQKLPWKVIREVEGQRGRDRGSQEAEDFEKHRRGVEFSHMETDLDMDYCILIFIFCVTRMELRPNAWVFWLTITGRLEELRPDAWAFWLTVSWFGLLRSSAWGNDMTVTQHMAMRSSS